jgi:hypothetical protein
VNVRLARALCFIVASVALGCDDSTTTLSTPPTPSPKTETFSSLLTPQGFVSHGFVLSAAGTITATLATLTAPQGVQVGFGVGVPAGTLSSCSLTRSLNTGPGAVITLEADAGTYCAVVYDLNTLAATATFSMTITHP